MKRNEDSLRHLWDNVKCPKVWIIGVLEEDKKKDHEKILEEIIVENFLKMGKEIVTQVQEIQRVPNRINPRQNSPRHILIKLIKDGAHLLDIQFSSVQFSSVAQSCPILCDPMNRSTPGLPVHHQLLEFTQTHVHQVCDAIQPSHLLSYPSPPALNPSQHQSLFQWVNSSHEVAKELELQLQYQSFQWMFRVDFL